MTESARRTVLGPVFAKTPSVVDQTTLGEVAGLIKPDTSATPPETRILAWIERDARRIPARDTRRIFEVVSSDGRSLVALDTE